MFGFYNKILNVDVTRKAFEVEVISDHVPASPR
jgi:hypothetical protein